MRCVGTGASQSRGVAHVGSDNRRQRAEPPDARVANQAGEQHAAITFRQLLNAGLSRRGISDRVKSRRLVPLWRGAYCVGHKPLTIETWIAAAVLLTKGIASHITAAYLWGLRVPRPGEPIHVTAQTRRRNRPQLGPAHDQPALIAHRAKLDSRWTRRHGIKVTSAERTILDCCATEPYRNARRLTGQALVTKRVSIHSLLTELDRNPGHHGTRALRHILLIAQPTRSEAEDLLNAVLHQHDITGFKANVHIPGVGELDFYDPIRRIALEFDSRQFHDNPITRADDHAKRKRAQTQGIHIHTIRWRDITTGHHKTAARVLALGSQDSNPESEDQNLAC